MAFIDQFADEPLAQREEWADVQPLDILEGHPVVAIQYTARHREALAYFRAILCTEEKSARVLDLTTLIISFNSADYTAWQYRWECLQALGTDLTTEYPFMAAVAHENIKNYQLWNHRRKVALALGKDHVDSELEFVEAALSKDNKNVHAWGHRQVVVKEFGMLDSELEHCEKYIKQDVRNNSAWNQRMFVIASTLETDTLPHILEQEFAFVREHLLKAPRNESAWVYLQGLLKLPGCTAHEAAKHPFLFNLCCDVLRDNNSNAGALDTLAMYYSSLAAAALEQHQIDAARQAACQAISILKLLETVDPIRLPYWVHRQDDLAVFCNGLGNAT